MKAATIGFRQHEPKPLSAFGRISGMTLDSIQRPFSGGPADALKTSASRKTLGILDGLGAILGYESVPRGTAYGVDQIWRSSGHFELLVKVVDQFGKGLSTAEIVRMAHARGELSTALLLVTQEPDTDDLEARIRGIREAWNVRIISKKNLIELSKICSTLDREKALWVSSGALHPHEYTNVGRIVDYMMELRTDGGVPEPKRRAQIPDPAPMEQGCKKVGRPLRIEIESKREAARQALELQFGERISNTRTIAYRSEGGKDFCISVSKKIGRPHQLYWFSLYPRPMRQLDSSTESFHVFVCLDRQEGYAVPFNVLKEIMPFVSTTKNSKGECSWHFSVVESDSGDLVIDLPRLEKQVPIGQYAFPLGCHLA